MTGLPPFSELAADPRAGLDLLALALAAEFRDVHAADALATLDALGQELSRAAQRTSGAPDALAAACRQVLAAGHGFVGDRADYDHPDNSMLDLVLVRRRGLPILLSVVYIEVARRAEIQLAGVGLPGHFVVGQFASDPPLLIDPFDGGATLTGIEGAITPWRTHDIAMRMLNNLVTAYHRRGDLGNAIRAAQMRLELPYDESQRDILIAELRSLHARMN